MRLDGVPHAAIVTPVQDFSKRTIGISVKAVDRSDFDAAGGALAEMATDGPTLQEGQIAAGVESEISEFGMWGHAFLLSM